MAKFCPLFSGSDGNATYISHRGSGLLIDAGSSYKALIEALDRVGGSIDEIKAVAVTHEHSDHVKGLHTLLNKNDIPLIASKQTADTLIASGKVPPKTKIVSILFSSKKPFAIILSALRLKCVPGIDSRSVEHTVEPE